ncbi:MAG: hypothetical protein FWF79_03190 [Defluviitaleaceae bacterium]|nr:hypothetical protein [Defluviitaleaceae bacterium]
MSKRFYEFEQDTKDTLDSVIEFANEQSSGSLDTEYHEDLDGGLFAFLSEQSKLGKLPLEKKKARKGSRA